MGRFWGTEIMFYNFTVKARMEGLEMSNDESHDPVWNSVFGRIWPLMLSHTGISV